MITENGLRQQDTYHHNESDTKQAEPEVNTEPLSALTNK